MEAKKLPVAKVLKFAIPSLLGAALFLIPMKINGEFVLGVSILCDIIQGWMNPFVDMLALILLGTSAIVPILAKIFKPGIIMNHKQRCTRGYKRYKETSGLIEWKECQIFHSIFT